MELRVSSALMLVALLTFAPGLSAKGETIKITIAGGGLAEPIVITDAAVLKQFNVWSGPGTGGSIGAVPWKATDGFVIEGSPLEDVPHGLLRYEVAFVVDRGGRDDRRAYTIFYEHDAATDRGYVYIPGRDDPHWSGNVFLICGSTEGRWDK